MVPPHVFLLLTQHKEVGSVCSQRLWRRSRVWVYLPKYIKYYSDELSAMLCAVSNLI